MKYFYTAITSLIIGVAIAFYLKGCEKKVYIQGKSWTVTKNDTIHYHTKEYIPVPKYVYRKIHDTLRIVDTNETINHLPDTKNMVSVYSDSVRLGKASVVINDSVQGLILGRSVSCIGCGFDTVFVSRTDTIKQPRKFKDLIYAFGAGYALGVLTGAVVK